MSDDTAAEKEASAQGTVIDGRLRAYFMSERQQTLMRLAQLDALLGLPPTVVPKHKRRHRGGDDGGNVA